MERKRPMYNERDPTDVQNFMRVTFSGEVKITVSRSSGCLVPMVLRSGWRSNAYKDYR